MTLTTNSTENKSFNETTNTTNPTNLNSSSTSTFDTIKDEFNLTETTIESHNPTISPSTIASPLNGEKETLTPIISSPWLKGMLVNTKSLPELFKIIEKLNFNLTLSNRYLQELSQHYVYD